MKKAVKVYLAGGMRSGWQDKVMSAVRERLPNVPLIFLDPRQNGTSSESTYTAWDMDAVEISDVLFGYLEADNLAGQGLCVEFGQAEGMRRAGHPKKHIIFVCEPEHPKYRYFGMARECADTVTDSLDKGIDLFIEFLLQSTY